MRIGTLTLVYPENDNYGAYLQGYALCRAINRIEGFNATCLLYSPNLPADASTRQLWKWSDLRYASTRYNPLIRTVKRIGFMLRSFFRFLRRKTIQGERLARFKTFGELFQKTDRFFFSSEQLAEAQVDAYVVGSDWVWALFRDHTGSLVRRAYHGFIPTEKPIFSYAASFGVQPTEQDEMTFVRSFAQNFCTLSCREKEGAKLLNNLGFEKARQDVDPTLLLEKDEWNQVTTEPPPRETSKPLVAVYWLPNDDAERVAGYVKVARLKFPDSQFVVLNPNPVAIEGAVYRSDIGPQDFLGYIRAADYVITNSFHACVFSCVFEKHFTVFPRYKGDERIQNLLQATQLETRLVTEPPKTDPINLPIDWTNVREKLRAQASDSFERLKSDLLDYERTATHQ